jgi:hypothetical protein
LDTRSSALVSRRARLLVPQLPAPLVALVLGFGALAEGAFALWLLVSG